MLLTNLIEESLKRNKIRI